MRCAVSVTNTLPLRRDMDEQTHGVVRHDVAELASRPWYSHVVVANGFAFVSGMLGVAPNSGELVPGGISAEARQALSNVRLVLSHVGASLEDVVRVDVYLADLADVDAINQEFMAAFGAALPARTAVQVARLAFGGRAELTCVAVVRDGQVR